jgi:mannose-6-phosphate isomerase-like protein (cupin superfamily)
MQSFTPPGTVLSAAGAPAERRAGDTVEVRTVVDGAGYAEPLVHRVLTAGPGRSLPRREAGADELLLVTSGAGLLLGDGDGDGDELVEGTGVLLRAGETWSLDVPERLELASVLVPAPPGPWASAAARDVPPGPRTRRLGSSAKQDATSGREFEVLFDARHGSRGATSFVGRIPAAGAPAHYHLYDEICVILHGEGALHVGATPQPLRPGDAFHVAPRLLHGVENTGPGDLVLLGVFRPAGSAAAAYYPDGRPAPNNADE